MGDLIYLHNVKVDICDYCQQYGVESIGQMSKDIFNEAVIFKCFNCLSVDKDSDIPTALSPQDQNKAGWCEHGRRTLSQGMAKSTGKPWRKEDCPVKVCRPIWWYWQGQIRCWISPRENNDYL